MDKESSGTASVKKHIAFFTAPAHGHINPTLAVASALLEKGYRVTYAIPERFSRELSALGVEVVTYSTSFIPEGFSGEEERNRRLNGLSSARDPLSTHGFFQGDNRPDLIIYDHLDIGGTVLSKLMPDIPSIKFFPSFSHNEHFPLTVRGFSADTDWTEKTAQALDEALSLEGIGDYFLNHVNRRNVVFIPHFFQYLNDTFDSRFDFVGPSLSRRAFYGSWSPPAACGRVILISLGTVLNAQVDFFRMCISELGQMDVHVVMSVGKGVEISLLEPIPPNFEIYPFVSHLDILPHASAYVGHGGMNSTMEALYYGVPLLLAPQDGNQKLIAGRAVELGLGKILPQPYLARGVLKDSLCTLLQNSELLDRVKEVGATMRAIDSTGQVIAVIEKCLRRGRSDDRTCELQ